MGIENIEELKDEPKDVGLKAPKSKVQEMITPRNREERRLAKRQQRKKGR